jgi:hypothetical protein
MASRLTKSIFHIFWKPSCSPNRILFAGDKTEYHNIAVGEDWNDNVRGERWQNWSSVANAC